MIEKINEHGLVDAFRELNPNERKFTWKQWGSNKRGRLDYFLVSNTLLPYIESAKITSGSFSDHSLILLDVDFTRFQQGRGFWKLNNSLLMDKHYVDMIKNTIKVVSCQYAAVNKDHNLIQNMTPQELETFLSQQTPEILQEMPLNINAELFLDTLLMEIRKVTIKYSSFKKKERFAEQQLLMHDIEVLESSHQPQDEFTRKELSQKRAALERILEYEAEGAYIRSRAKYRIEGEKPTKLFCALETSNNSQKYVPQLIIQENDNEVLLCSQNQVESEIYNFYRDLFANKDNIITGGSIEDFLGEEEFRSLPKLTESQKKRMEGPITTQELTDYLKKTKNNVAPGVTGFTNEFFKFFWRDLKIFVTNSVDFSFRQQRLSSSKSLGIISIIPKGDKDKRFLSNWRPITLLDTLYKIISGCIAERIKPALYSLINPDQKGFVAGRYIGEVVRTTADIIEFAKVNNVSGIILLLDFEKAYDSISFSYIIKCLHTFNFCEDMITWVKILLNNFKAVINHCGNCSPSFSIGRGCRQGDPIASYLFILCIEILAHRLRNDPKIKCFSHKNVAHLLEIYADDMTVFLDPKAENLRQAIQVLNSFYMLSGLKISVHKTKAVWFGSKYDSNEKLCPEISLNWVKNFDLLGITFDNNLEKMEENFQSKIQKIESLLGHWSYRYLSPFGKVTVLKTLALSKLSHVALVVPNPSKNFFKKLESIFYKFLWKKGSEKVCRQDTKLPEKLGGLGMPNIEQDWTSFKISWHRRLLTTESYWPNILLSNIAATYKTLTVTQLLELGPSLLAKIGRGMKNTFWGQVLISAVKITEGATFCRPQYLLSTSFWHNPFIKRNKRVIDFKDFPELQSKISFLADFFLPGTCQLMDIATFKEHYQVDISDEKYIDIRYCIKLAFQCIRFPISKLVCAARPLTPALIDIALITKKGCSAYNKILSQKSWLESKIGKRDEKWHRELNCVMDVSFWDKARLLGSKIPFNNNLKWLQYQINRKSLQTNYIVSHFKPNVSPLCTFCNQEDEIISHLFEIINQAGLVLTQQS